MSTPVPTSGEPVPGTPTPPMPPPSVGKVVAVVGSIILATVVAVMVLWWAGTAGLNGDKLVTARLDALRTGLSIGIGGGGALALYLSWRRQRATEIALAQAATALAQKDRDHDHTEADARERRITDLYTKAVEQLGSDKAPVRLGGLYALERLAQGNIPQRQTIVNVLCAYLRMPFVMPVEIPADGVDPSLLDSHREQLQEREVRLAAQRILASHLHGGNDEKGPDERFWSDIDIDLTAAVLIDFEFRWAVVGVARFRGAKFIGDAWFSSAKFKDVAHFDGAQFLGGAQFGRVQFADYVSFGDVKFCSSANFSSARFEVHTYFARAHFCGDSAFYDAYFGTAVGFHKSKFDGEVKFRNVHFEDPDGQILFFDSNFSGVVPPELERYVGS